MFRIFNSQNFQFFFPWKFYRQNGREIYEFITPYFLKTCLLFWPLNNVYTAMYFVAHGSSHIKIIWLHNTLFNEYDILHFRDNVHLSKHQMKVPQNCCNSTFSSSADKLKISITNLKINSFQ